LRIYLRYFCILKKKWQTKIPDLTRFGLSKPTHRPVDQ
jgi:hypothetical protein